MSNLVEHARSELVAAGMLGTQDGDTFNEYNHMCGKAVLELTEVFANQGHLGMSASIVLGMFKEVADWKPLSPLTDNPEEWMMLESSLQPGKENCWQSRRRPDCFSRDRGKTYYSVDEFRRGWRRKLFGRIGKKYKSKSVQ